MVAVEWCKISHYLFFLYNLIATISLLCYMTMFIFIFWGFVCQENKFSYCNVEFENGNEKYLGMLICHIVYCHGDAVSETYTRFHLNVLFNIFWSTLSCDKILKYPGKAKLTWQLWTTGTVYNCELSSNRHRRSQGNGSIAALLPTHHQGGKHTHQYHDVNYNMLRNIFSDCV